MVLLRRSGTELSHAAQEHPRTRFPAALPEQAGPQHLAAFKVTSSPHQQEKMEAVAPKPLSQAPDLPQRSSSWATKLESWFPAPLHQLEPGMLMFAQLEQARCPRGRPDTLGMGARESHLARIPWLAPWQSSG